MRALLVASVLTLATATGCGSDGTAVTSGNSGGASFVNASGGATNVGTGGAVLTGGQAPAVTLAASGGIASSTGGSAAGGAASSTSSMSTGGLMSSGGTTSATGGVGNGGASSAVAAGGTVSAALGGASAGGGIANTGGVVSTGGAHTGGSAGGGGITTTAAGGTSGDSGPATVVKMTLQLGESQNDTSTIDLSLPDGAALVSVADITLTLCGRLGGGTALDTHYFVFPQVALLCPVTSTLPDCAYGANYQIQPSVSVSPPGMSGCYTIDLGSPERNLYVGGHVKIVYKISQDVTGAILNRQFEEVWSVLVDGDTVGHCTIPPLPGTTPVCS